MILEAVLLPNAAGLVIWQGVGIPNEVVPVIFAAARLRNAAVLDPKHKGRTGWIALCVTLADGLETVSGFVALVLVVVALGFGVFDKLRITIQTSSRAALPRSRRPGLEPVKEDARPAAQGRVGQR